VVTFEAISQGLDILSFFMVTPELMGQERLRVFRKFLFDKLLPPITRVSLVLLRAGLLAAGKSPKTMVELGLAWISSLGYTVLFSYIMWSFYPRGNKLAAWSALLPIFICASAFFSLNISLFVTILLIVVVRRIIFVFGVILFVAPRIISIFQSAG
jgi:hypothetical protein